MTAPEAVEPTATEEKSAVEGGEAGTLQERSGLPGLPLESDRREGTPSPAEVSTHP
ncbi:hypothetical protein GXW82_08375 [Streptacidiphilus sp. 4-A2]|nr:hypothetical protein [Streptacidiphilus sp. 4-A2]